MRRTAPALVLAAALLAGCGGTAATPQPAAPASVPATAAASSGTAAPTGAPATATPNATAIPTSAPTTEPTSQLILEPSSMPEAANQAGAPTANSAAQAARPAPAPSAAPTRLVVKDIGLDYRPVTVGLDKQLVPIVPEHDVGWYKYSSGPGEGENIVLWGHVLRFKNQPNTPAPFARVKELQPGAGLVLYDSAGNPHRYVIKQQVWVKPDQVEYILPQGKEMVTLVSCIGDKVISNGEVIDESHRLITIAEPA